MARKFSPLSLFLLLFLFSSASATSGVPATPRAARWLPGDTVALLAIPDRGDLDAKWQQTQLGQLLTDEGMQPVLESLQEQFQGELHKLDERLGVDWAFAREVDSRELALAVTQPAGPESVAFALLAETRISSSELQAMRRKLDQSLLERGATRRQIEAGTVYTLPAPSSGPRVTRHIVHAVRDQLFIATSDEQLARQILARLDQPAQQSRLADHPAFQAVVERSRLTSHSAADLFWYIEPTGYVQAVRAARGDELRRGASILKSLQNQGFDAVGAVGGQVVLGQDDTDIAYRTFLHLTKPLSLAARMLDFPNGAKLQPQPWVPAGAVGYLSLRWNMRDAFEHARHLVNEIADDEVFEEMLKDIKEDPNGPQLDIRHDIVQHLGQRLTVITDNKQPVTPLSKRFLVAIELRDPVATADALNRALDRFPNSLRQQVGTSLVWEMQKEQEEEELTLTVEIEGPGFGFGPGAGFEPPKEEPQPSQVANMVIGVVDSQLIIGNDLEFANQVFSQPDGAPLTDTAPYLRVDEALEKLGAGQESFRIFSRVDEAFHAAYEMLRSGETAGSDGLLAQLLNQSNENSYEAQWKLDGSKLPEFETIRDYLGPAGLIVETSRDGWTISGCVLRK